MRGRLIVNCVDKGARNHIEVCALLSLLFSIKNAVFCWFEHSIDQVKKALDTINIIGVIFKYRGRNISVEGLNKIQFNPLPPVIAATLRISVGVEQKLSVSLRGFIGRHLLGHQTVASKNRTV